jgi:hypothetical protein
MTTHTAPQTLSHTHSNPTVPTPQDLTVSTTRPIRATRTNRIIRTGRRFAAGVVLAAAGTAALGSFAGTAGAAPGPGVPAVDPSVTGRPAPSIPRPAVPVTPRITVPTGPPAIELKPGITPITPPSIIVPPPSNDREADAGGGPVGPAVIPTDDDLVDPDRFRVDDDVVIRDVPDLDGVLVDADGEPADDPEAGFEDDGEATTTTEEPTEADAAEVDAAADDPGVEVEEAADEQAPVDATPTDADDAAEQRKAAGSLAFTGSDAALPLAGAALVGAGGLFAGVSALVRRRRARS